MFVFLKNGIAKPKIKKEMSLDKTVNTPYPLKAYA